MITTTATMIAVVLLPFSSAGGAAGAGSSGCCSGASGAGASGSVTAGAGGCSASTVGGLSACDGLIVFVVPATRLLRKSEATPLEGSPFKDISTSSTPSPSRSACAGCPGLTTIV